MRTRALFSAFLVAVLFLVMPSVAAACQQEQPKSPQAQQPCQGIGCETDSPPPTPSPTPAEVSREPVTFKRAAFLNLPGDQKAIWTGPFHLHPQDSFWLVPLVGSSAVLVGSDEHSMQRARSNQDAINLSNNIADVGVAGMVAVPAAMYLWGSWHGAPRARETGLLSGEAVINSVAVNELLKLIFARERPTASEGQGRFFQGINNNASFPSLHATISWTAASVIAHEYPGWLSQSLVYAAASTVSIARVTGRQHFPGDVVVGSALGWLIGRQVYNRHHDTDLDELNYGRFSHQPGDELDASSLGSPFVPLDSWVYPELKRLAALGYIRSQFAGLEPWTRAECRRQLDEADYFTQDLSSDSSVRSTIDLLRQELSDDQTHYYTAQVNSVYTRYTQIAGTPLRDSYHFGQTLWNDYGRPYDQGGNLVTGARTSAVAGPFFFHVQGEYQHAPGRGTLTAAQSQAIAIADSNPILPPNPVNTIDRFYPVEMYGGVKLGEYALTFGKASFWLGPTESGPLMLSDNADPMYTLAFSRTTPLVLPGIFHWLGQISGEFLFSKLSGHQFPQRPFFNLQKISFRFTDNLEMGFTRASIWAGVGHPFTARALGRNFFTVSDTLGPFGDPTDPGDRKSGFDFSYRVPGLRNWLTVYSDMYSDDDPSPLANPRRAAVNPGFYISHLPGIAKLDLRGEAASTQLLTSQELGPQFIYFNNQYHDANTNKGFLFGNPVGRDGKTYSGWSTYHFSGVNTLTVGFRQLKMSNRFFAGGGTQTDANVRFNWKVRPQLLVSAFVQQERWLIPILRQNAQHDVTGQLELSYTPHWRVHHD